MTEQSKNELLSQFNIDGTADDAHTEDEKTLILNLCELFSEIDFNGERFITWEDFTTYLIDTATDQHSRLQDRIKEVCTKGFNDRNITLGSTAVNQLI